MRFFLFIATLLGSFCKALFFKSDSERLGAADEKNRNLEKQIAVRKAMDEAPKISKIKQLHEILRSGKLIILAAFFVSACSTTTALTCPTIKKWTGEQQAQMVLDLKKLPEQSPVNEALMDYFNMRQEARACIGSL